MLQIKDLKDLRFLSVGVTIDMQDLKDLKRCFFTGALAGDRPPHYGEKKRIAARRARACPSPCLGRGNGFGWRAFFAQVE